jgi:hypothetical protein
MGDLIAICGRSYEGKVQKEYDLQPRDSKYRDKYVGGQIIVFARVEEEKKVRLEILVHLTNCYAPKASSKILPRNTKYPE